MDGSISNQVIRLAPMQQLAEAFDEEDDWTGLIDAAARRKRQNRLNQRAYRRRKAEELHLREDSHYDNHQGINHSHHYQEEQPEILQMTPQGQKALQIVLSFLQGPQPTPRNENSLTIASTPLLTPAFPLSTDHLIPLIQLNVLRATLTNMSLLSILHEVPLECGAPQFLPLLLLPVPNSVPPCLAPTPLQRSTPHSHWIDVIPSPTMRDNCIRLAGLVDEDDLCSDLVGGLYEGNADLDTKGWIVWQDPWDVSGWEVTEGFLRKWGFLLAGCHHMIEASNRWRALRGEDALVVEL